MTTIEEAAQTLSRIYLGASDDEKVVQIHLFGIQFADQLQNLPLDDLVARAGLSKSYRTEIRKGMNLAKYVELKEI